MTKSKANTITELARTMLINARSNFNTVEYIASVELFCNIVSELLPSEESNNLPVDIDKAKRDSNNVKVKRVKNNPS